MKLRTNDTKKLLAALIVLGAVPVLGAFWAAPARADVAPPAEPTEQWPAGPVDFNVACGDHYTMLDSAPANTWMRLNNRSCECGGSATNIVVSAIKDGKVQPLCDLKPGQACEKNVPAGASVMVAASGAREDKECKVSGHLKY